MVAAAMPSTATAFLADRLHTLSRITLADGESTAAWVQVAKTGVFHSPVYGIVTITPDDLRTMLSNYQHEHPIPPTELMLDYEHLSANPQTPRDGESAGWFKQVELRNGDKEFWALIELTEDAADAVRKKKYRYISPEISRSYRSKKTGRTVGYCLKAAALTNRPFLEGMEPVSLQLSDAAGTRSSVATLLAADVADLPYSERERRVREALNEKHPPTYGPDGINFESWINVHFVYEDRAVFSKGSRTFAQSYTFNDDLSITFDGEPYEVIVTDTPVLSLCEPSDDIVIDVPAGAMPA
jgi:hypothetical protein